jgi:hypothetical protein
MIRSAAITPCGPPKPRKAVFETVFVLSVVAVRPDLDRAAQPGGCQRRGSGEQVRLRLFAAESAAHPAGLDRDRMRGDRQDARDDVLRLARMLGRAVNRYVPVLARRRHRDLALQVEMFLATDLEPARKPPRRLGDRCGRVAARELQR